MLGYYARNIKDFTQKLFLSDCFDAFLVPEASFATAFTTEFDGRLFSEESSEPYVKWEVLRPIAFQLIRGRTLPRSFSLVFMLSKEKTADFLKACDSSFAPEEVGGLFLNIRYSREQLSVTTGVSLTGFSTDKSLDRAWDKQIGRFLDQQGLGES